MQDAEKGGISWREEPKRTIRFHSQDAGVGPANFARRGSVASQMTTSSVQSIRDAHSITRKSSVDPETALPIAYRTLYV